MAESQQDSSDSTRSTPQITMKVDSPEGDSSGEEAADNDINTEIVKSSESTSKSVLSAAGDLFSTPQNKSTSSILKPAQLSLNNCSANNSPRPSFVLNPSRLNPFVKSSSDDASNNGKKSNQVNGETTPKFMPLFNSENKSSNNQNPVIKGSATVSSSSFVFGQNLQDRVIASDNKADEPRPSTSLNSNGTTELLFSSAIKNESKPDATPQNKETKSLSESAREYEESRANKRKYDEVEVRTGEEGETNILHVSCKLFAFDKNAGSWQERGRGVLRLNDLNCDDDEHTQSRLVFRTTGSLRVVLNTKVWAEMTVEQASEKSTRFTALDANGEIKVFLAMYSSRTLKMVREARMKAVKQEEQNGSNQIGENRNAVKIIPDAQTPGGQTDEKRQRVKGWLYNVQPYYRHSVTSQKGSPSPGKQQCSNTEEMASPSEPYQPSPTEYVPSNESDSDITDRHEKVSRIPHKKRKRSFEKCEDNRKERNSDDVQGIVHENEKVPLKKNVAKKKKSFRHELHDNMDIDVAKTNSGNRVRDKRHVCYFCNKEILHMARHFEAKHSNELEVARILAMPKNSTQRKEACAELMRVGDFYHNCNVLASRTGNLILVRRPKEKTSYSYFDYGPCPDCLGFTLKKWMWHHMKYNCKKRNEYMKNRSPINESNALICGLTAESLPQEFVDNIVSRLKDDVAGTTCRNDELILKFGLLRYEKWGNTQCELVRQQMRQLARFAIKLQEIDPECKKLSDCFVPEKFDTIIKATQQLCILSNSSRSERPKFNIPSLALKIGHAIKKCIGVLRGIALRKGDIRKNEQLVCLMQLVEMEWGIKISSTALSTLARNKYNCAQLLPLTDDLIKLTKYVDDKIKKIKSNFTTHENCASVWKTLASATLSRIILFNKRRSGEASKMTLTQYASRPNFTEQGTQELRDSLSPIEKELAARFAVVDTEGKRGRRVPVLLTPEMRSSIDLLIKFRNSADISKENNYLFARGNGSTDHLRGHDCLRAECDQAGLKNPAYITGTKLRKYVATVCQLLDLPENQCDWIARHLGHDIRVHREFYRLHENNIEATKISRLLIAVESGQISKFAGKSLEDINIEELPQLEDEDDIVSWNDSSSEISSVLGETEDLPDSPCQSVTPSKETREPKSKQNKANKKTRKTNEGSAQKIGTIKPPKPSRRSTGTKTKKSVPKKPWSQAECNAVRNFFKTNIKKEIVPGKADCENCIEINTVLISRKWTDIKFHVKNVITRNRRLLKK